MIRRDIWSFVRKAPLLFFPVQFPEILRPLLATLEQGLDTRVGEKGACLSGGEKQRLALARLMLDRSEIA